MAKVIATVSSFDTEGIKGVLALNTAADAPKLHALAEGILKALADQSAELVGTDGLIVSIAYSTAAYLEARATYLLLRDSPPRGKK